MKGFDNPTFLTLFIISNIVSLIMLLAAWKTPRIARILFFFLFAWAAYTNWTFAREKPVVYVEYADLTMLKSYERFIRGWFSNHILLVVSIIAICQFLVAISLMLQGSILKIGATGAVIFLVAISPLGLGAAFPATLIMALAIVVFVKKYDHEYIWKWHREEVNPSKT